MIDTSTSTIFADGNFYFGMVLMSSIQPCGKRSRCGPIPSIIAIPSYMISNEIQRAILITCRSSRTSRILPMCHSIQLLYILYRIVSLLFQFIEQSPKTDTRMIVMLADHLFQLLLTIFAERRLINKTFISVSSRPHKWNLSPSDNAIFIH